MGVFESLANPFVLGGFLFKPINAKHVLILLNGQVSSFLKQVNKPTIQLDGKPIFLILVWKLISPVDGLFSVCVNFSFSHFWYECLDLSRLLFLFYYYVRLH